MIVSAFAPVTAVPAQQASADAGGAGLSPSATVPDERRGSTGAVDSAERLTVRAEDANGTAVEGAQVVLYDSSWNAVGTKTADPSGEVSWSALDTGQYRVELYGPNGDYWATKADVQVADGSTTSTVQREAPRYVGVTLTGEQFENRNYSGGHPISMNDTATVEVDATPAETDRLQVTVRQVRRPEFPTVTVYGSVTGPDGTSVSGLTADDFAVTENGGEQPIESVEPVETTGGSNVSVSLVIDRSGSMDNPSASGERSKIADAKDAAERFVYQLDDGDEAQVIAFDDTVEYERRWTDESRAVTAAIDGIETDGRTALWRATAEGVDQSESRVGRSAVVVLTDGKNNEPPRDVDAAIDEAQAAGVPVYTIGLGESVDEDNLRRLAAETGGSYYFSPNSSELADIYAQIRQSITTEYKITYRTTNTATDGTNRTVRLTARNGGDSGSGTGTYQAPCAPLPTAEFEHAPNDPVDGQQVSFDAGQSTPNGGSIVAYRWDFDNDGVTDATGESAAHTYPDAGTYQARLTVEKSCGATDVRIKEVTVSPDDEPDDEAQRPFDGTPAAFPGRIQAQNFDYGGDDVAYNETTVGNKYDTSYRNGSVDIRETRDVSGEYAIGVFDEGDWLEYTVDPEPGTYTLRVRVATERSNRQLRLVLGGETLRTVDVPNTGDWYNWTTVTVENVRIDADTTQVLRVEPVNSGIDFNWIEFERASANPGGGQEPFGGSAKELPSRIQAQNFDYGGEGVAYRETTNQNRYETDYRDAPVDIRETQDSTGEYNIGVFQQGEWLEYTVDAAPGTYDIRLRVATARDDRQLRLSLGGEELRTVDVPNTGGWRNWQTVTVEDVEIDESGTQVLRVETVNSGIDFNWIEFEEASADGGANGEVDVSVSTGSDDAVAIGEPVQFDAAVTGLPAGASVDGYTWQFGDDAKGTGQSVAHQYVASGEYTATVTVTTNAGEEFSETTTMTVTDQFADVPPLASGDSVLNNSVYRIELSESESLGLEIGDNGHGNAVVLLYGPDGERIQTVGAPAGYGPRLVGMTADRSGTYYVAVNFTEYTPPWPAVRLTPHIRSPDQYEPNQERQSAAELPTNTTVTGLTLTEADGDDWYAISTDGPGIINVSAELSVFARTQGGLQLGIYNQNGDSIGTIAPERPADESSQTGIDIYNAVQRTTVDESGTYYVRVEGVNTDGITEYNLTVEVVPTTGPGSPPAGDSQEPFGGSAKELPSRIQAQDFDYGGEGVAYRETTDDNRYETSYRDAPVDIRETEDETGEYNIGVFQQGEWVEYTVVSAPGTYDVHLRIATPRDDRTLRLSLGGEELRTVDVPNTGGWREWQTVTVEDVEIDESGTQVLRVEAVNSGIDFNWIEFEESNDELTTSRQGAPGGTLHALPGEIDASHFDIGADRVASHHATTTRLDDGEFRPTASVQIEVSSRGDSGNDSPDPSRTRRIIRRKAQYHGL